MLNSKLGGSGLEGNGFVSLGLVPNRIEEKI